MPDQITTINPTTGQVLSTYESMPWAHVDGILADAAHAQQAWARTYIASRCEILLAVAAELRRRRDELAMLAVCEMGKPVAEAKAEVEKCAWVCEYYAQESPRALADELVEASGSRSWTSYEPLGTVLAIMPWNFPYWQVFRFAAPALAAGNAALLKHSPNVTACALAVQEVFEAAGLPEHLFTTILIAEPDVPTMVTRIIEDDRISAVTITGSNRAGAHVAMAAGAWHFGQRCSRRRPVPTLAGSNGRHRGRTVAHPGSPIRRGRHRRCTGEARALRRLRCGTHLFIR